jgi:hypothetical protein
LKFSQIFGYDAAMPTFDSLPAGERQRILNKLTRLKALSECKTGNVNETATAAAAMTRLMMEYKIEMAELEEGGSSQAAEAVQEQDVTSGYRGKSFPTWQSHLLQKLAEANDCVGFQSTQRGYDAWLRPVTAAKLCLIGRAQDIAHVRKVFVFCLHEIERLCLIWMPRASRTLKNDFRTGAALGIAEKVMAERAAVRAEEEARASHKGQSSRALIVLDRRLEEVRAAAHKIGVRFATSRGGRAMSASAYEAGYQAGQAIEFPGQAAPLPGR